MSKRRATLCFGLIWTFAAVACSEPPRQDDGYRVTGHTLDEQSVPVQDVEVYTLNLDGDLGDLKAMTTDDGTFSFEAPSGDADLHLLRFVKAPYRTVDVSVGLHGSLVDSKTYEIVVVLFDVTADRTAPSAIADLTVGPSEDFTSVILEWTAPGDDGYQGLANSYDLRYADFPLNESNWSTALELPGPKTPSAPRTQEHMELELPYGTLFFGIRTADEVPNWSRISNVVEFEHRFVDVVPPSTVADLHVEEAASNTVDLSWTAPGDDGDTGIASRYELRYSTRPITEETWKDANLSEQQPVPIDSGSLQSFTVAGLRLGTTYYFALRAFDDKENSSPISNVVEARTAGFDSVFEIGNWWRFHRESRIWVDGVLSESSGESDATVVTDTTAFGSTFALLERGGSPHSLLRLADQELYFVPLPAEVGYVPLGLEAEFDEIYQASLPWLVADLDPESECSDEPRNFFDETRTFDGRFGEAIVEYRYQVVCLGRTSVEVPAGRFDDVLSFRLGTLQRFEDRRNLGEYRIDRQSTTLFFAEDIGIVLRRDEFDFLHSGPGTSYHGTRVYKLMDFGEKP